MSVQCAFFDSDVEPFWKFPTEGFPFDAKAFGCPHRENALRNLIGIGSAGTPQCLKRAFVSKRYADTDICGGYPVPGADGVGDHDVPLVVPAISESH